MEIISNNKTAANTVEVEFKANAAEFEEAVQAAYLKKRKKLSNKFLSRKISERILNIRLKTKEA